MEIITNYLSASCETTNGQVIVLALSGIILGLVLGMVAYSGKANR